DDPGQPNLTWTYHGAPISGGGSGVQVTLFGFGAESTGGTPQEGLLFSFIHRDSDGKFVVDGTPVPVPVPGSGGNPGGGDPPGGGGPPDTPEPATLALMALGLPLVGLAGVFRRKVAVA